LVRLHLDIRFTILYIHNRQEGTMNARRSIGLGLAMSVLSVSIWGLIPSVLPQDESPVAFNSLTSAILPWDAVPGPDGTTIYFTGIGTDGQPDVFSISAGGGEVTPLAADAPLVMPLGIATSTDGQTLYVTDPWAAGSLGNAILALPSSGDGEATVVSGTQGTIPQGIELVSHDGADQIYFTGIDPTDGQPAVYSIPAAGGTVTLIAKGKPLVAPSGISVAKDGTVYVLDRLASGNGLGSVVRINSSGVNTIAENVRTGGQIAGLTLTMDEALLLVSSLDSTAGTAQVLVVDLATMQSSIINNVINANTGAGGLHRAHNVNEFAWADLTAGTAGTVYKVTFK
jgi:hypothetical protein